MINLTPADTKTRRGRRVELAPSPALAELLDALPRRGEYVFDLSDKEATNARQRLCKRLGWQWTFQELRQTCASYSCSAPWYGPFRSAKRLGHSTIVADRLYAGSVAIPPDATDLETAMGVGDLAGTVVALLHPRRETATARAHGPSRTKTKI